eukprot:9140653-Alexandrium_andersonii.AAC.1
MEDDALAWQVAAPRGGAQSCPVRAPSPMLRCPSGGGPERDLKGLCGGGLASLLGVKALGKRPVLRLTPN